MLLAQAESFADDGPEEEAVARARQAIAYVERELAERPDGHLREQLEQRMLLAEGLLGRLGRSIRDGRGDLRVHPEDAFEPKTWA